MIWLPKFIENVSLLDATQRKAVRFVLFEHKARRGKEMQVLALGAGILLITPVNAICAVTIKLTTAVEEIPSGMHL